VEALHARADIEVGEGHPETDAFQQQVGLDDRYRAIRPLARRRTPQAAAIRSARSTKIL
jgi:hypothetical protein